MFTVCNLLGFDTNIFQVSLVEENIERKIGATSGFQVNVTRYKHDIIFLVQSFLSSLLEIICSISEFHRENV